MYCFEALHPWRIAHDARDATPDEVTLHAKFNEAIAHIPQWSDAGIRHTTRGTLGWGPASSSAVTPA